MTKRVAVVGGGIIGTAVARELTRRLPGVDLTLFEKETGLARHQTGHNSGVVHAGLYYEPGSQKAHLCRRGVGLLTEFAEEHSIAHEICGKVVVARTETEVQLLRNILNRAVANGVPGVELLSPAALRDIEPHVEGMAALHSPTTSIIDYAAVTEALAREVVLAGGTIELGTRVTRLAFQGGLVRVTSCPTSDPASAESATYDLVVTCAGLHSDRLAPRTGDQPRIIPFFGTYLEVSEPRAHLVRGLVYPVPDPRYPFLGVHLTPTVDGRLLLGPNAFLALDREGYAARAFNPRDVVDILGFRGFWRFAASNTRAAARELAGVLTPRFLVRDAQTMFPDLRPADVAPAGRGVRAQAVTPAGRLLDDFAIRSSGPLVEVLNTPSPGATASLAIAEHIVNEALTVSA
ncbi:L-2-hydroxyglutarate oxidase [Sphaerisporangium sp. NPDC051017]|uniref:L-2-hydroxyglutarate oxidase n=1 Tax=Sphaerisporangium sp. NPDC051017 TaxID=3154636 RepID=UPI003417974B